VTVAFSVAIALLNVHHYRPKIPAAVRKAIFNAFLKSSIKRKKYK
jgi:hypothetical protein